MLGPLCGRDPERPRSGSTERLHGIAAPASCSPSSRASASSQRARSTAFPGQRQVTLLTDVAVREFDFALRSPRRRQQRSPPRWSIIRSLTCIDRACYDSGASRADVVRRPLSSDSD